MKARSLNVVDSFTQRNADDPEPIPAVFGGRGGVRQTALQPVTRPHGDKQPLTLIQLSHVCHCITLALKVASFIVATYLAESNTDVNCGENKHRTGLAGSHFNDMV